jgi:hypothetical protein
MSEIRLDMGRPLRKRDRAERGMSLCAACATGRRNRKRVGAAAVTKDIFF